MKTRAIVLSTLKYGEASMIVEMLTEESGRVSFAVGIPKTSKARVKKQFFQPMTILELEYDHRERAQLQRIRDVRLASPYTSIPFDPVKLPISLFLAEFLYHATRGEQRNAPLFQYVEQSMLWLDAAQQHFANFHLVFMMRLSRFVGFYPNLEKREVWSVERGVWSVERGEVRGEVREVDKSLMYFDLREAAFVSSAPLHPDFLQPEEASRVQTLMRMNYESMHLFRLSRAERNRITELLLLYYRLHLPQMPELLSFAVVRELFS